MVANPPGPKVVLIADTLMLAMGWPFGSVTVPVIEAPRASWALMFDTVWPSVTVMGVAALWLVALSKYSDAYCRPWKSENWTV